MFNYLLLRSVYQSPVGVRWKQSEGDHKRLLFDYYSFFIITLYHRNNLSHRNTPSVFKLPNDLTSGSLPVMQGDVWGSDVSLPWALHERMYSQDWSKPPYLIKLYDWVRECDYTSQNWLHGKAEWLLKSRKAHSIASKSRLFPRRHCRQFMILCIDHSEYMKENHPGCPRETGGTSYSRWPYFRILKAQPRNLDVGKFVMEPSRSQTRLNWSPGLGLIHVERVKTVAMPSCPGVIWVS